ncbi:MAG: hypothetical protein AB2689_25710 [Candidatus Thiodiazotropha taylori]
MNLRNLLHAVGNGDQILDEFPEVWPYETYQIPASPSEPKFYAVRIDHRQLAEEIKQPEPSPKKKCAR